MTNKSILIGILLIFILMFSVNVYADNNIQDIVKSKIDIPESYIVSNSAVADGNVSKFWWRTPTDAENGGEISVTADENGNILNYYHFKNDYISKDEGAHFSVYDKSDSRFFALRFIERVCPELADKVEYNKSSLESNISKNMKTASVSYYRVENNVPYYDNYMNFIIDLNTAQVVQYTLKWDFDAVFPDVSNTIAQSEAMRQYNSLVGIGLQYRIRDIGGKKVAYLVYCPNEENAYIDATTGMLIKQEKINAEFDSDMESFDDGTIISDTVIDNAQLDIQSAEQYVRNIPETCLDNSYSLTYSSYEEINGNYCINLEFSKVPDKAVEEMTEEEFLMYQAGDYSYVRIKIDIRTKDIISMRCYNKESVLNPVSEDMAKWSIEKFLKTYMPLKYDNCRFSESKSSLKDNIYKAVYICYVGDIPYLGNNITVEYDCNTGKFASINCQWVNDVDFSATTDKIGYDRAKQILYMDVTFDLAYINTTDGIKLVYMLYPYYPAAVSADDGSLKNSDGSKYRILKYDHYLDIEGHYANGMIMRLNNNLIITSDDEKVFRPDANVSQKDFLAWMTAALTGTNYENTDDMYNYLVVNKIISSSEIRPEAEILKEDAIVFFIRALGYESIAKAEDIYRLTFADSHIITPSKIGYIAVAKGIGMISGDENNCVKPKTPLTRSDACCMIYKYLSR